MSECAMGRYQTALTMRNIISGYVTATVVLCFLVSGLEAQIITSSTPLNLTIYSSCVQNIIDFKSSCSCDVPVEPDNPLILSLIPKYLNCAYKIMFANNTALQPTQTSTFQQIYTNSTLGLSTFPIMSSYLYYAAGLNSSFTMLANDLDTRIGVFSPRNWSATYAGFVPRTNLTCPCKTGTLIYMNLTFLPEEFLNVTAGKNGSERVAAIARETEDWLYDAFNESSVLYDLASFRALNSTSTPNSVIVSAVAVFQANTSLYNIISEFYSVTELNFPTSNITFVETAYPSLAYTCVMNLTKGFNCVLFDTIPYNMTTNLTTFRPLSSPTTAAVTASYQVVTNATTKSSLNNTQVATVLPSSTTTTQTKLVATTIPQYNITKAFSSFFNELATNLTLTTANLTTVTATTTSQPPSTVSTTAPTSSATTTQSFTAATTLSSTIPASASTTSFYITVTKPPTTTTTTQPSTATAHLFTNTTSVQPSTGAFNQGTIPSFTTTATRTNTISPQTTTPTATSGSTTNNLLQNVTSETPSTTEMNFVDKVAYNNDIFVGGVKVPINVFYITIPVIIGILFLVCCCLFCLHGIYLLGRKSDEYKNVE